MPNWTRNSVETNNPEVIKAIMNQDGKVDFNVLIPMPEALNIEEGSKKELAITYFVTERLTVEPENTELSKLIPKMYSPLWVDENLTQLIEQTYRRTFEFCEKAEQSKLDELYRMGKQYLHNYTNYGYFTWYRWSKDKWGTKWNAIDSDVDYTIDGIPKRVSFCTAWCEPLPIYEKLCTMFPDDMIVFQAIYEGGGFAEYENWDGTLTQNYV